MNRSLPKLLTKEKPEYRVNVQTHIHTEEEVIEIKDMERDIMSLKNSRMCRLKSICVELLKRRTKKLYQIVRPIQFLI